MPTIGFSLPRGCPDRSPGIRARRARVRSGGWVVPEISALLIAGQARRAAGSGNRTLRATADGRVTPYLLKGVPPLHSPLSLGSRLSALFPVSPRPRCTSSRASSARPADRGPDVRFGPRGGAAPRRPGPDREGRLERVRKNYNMYGASLLCRLTVRLLCVVGPQHSRLRDDHLSPAIGFLR